MLSKLSPTTYEATVTAVATEFHEIWRRGHQASKGLTAPRWKATGDTAWAAKNSGQPYHRQNGSQHEVDINIPFGQLPLDWQEENAKAAEFAVRIVTNAILLGEPLDLEKLSHQVHEAWLVRQRLQPVTPGQMPYYRSSGQDVAYADLPEAEKDKDRDQVKLAEQLVLAMLS